MSRLYYLTLLSKAEIHLRELPAHISRVQYNFIPDRSMDNAIRELREALKLIEQARENYSYSDSSKSSSVVSSTQT